MPHLQAFLYVQASSHPQVQCPKDCIDSKAVGGGEISREPSHAQPHSRRVGSDVEDTALEPYARERSRI